MSAAERFIPFPRSDIVEMCAGRVGGSVGAEQQFRSLARILESVIHFEFHERLEHLKACFAPDDPDPDTRRLREPDARERSRLQAEFLREMTALLDAANYERVTRDDLERSLGEASLFKIRLHVDFDDFEDVLLYRRGESVRCETLHDLLGLRRREIEFTHYERVVFYVRFKGPEYFAAKERDELLFEPGSSVIKLFQNVPRADMEMLFPNTEVRMRTLDKLVIGVPAAAGGVTVAITKLGGTLLLVGSLVAFWLGMRDERVVLDQGALVVLASGLFALAAFLWRQVTKFKNRKIRFMKTLSENLYFKNLDNGAGVFHRLLDAAEEEECKEVLLAYVFLLTAERDPTAHELDAAVEEWLRKEFDCELDFEVSDALPKLERLELAERRGQRWRGAPLDRARQGLDARWDGYFAFEEA